MTGSSVFLTAQWRYLAMLNYRVEPDLLAPHVPAGTKLDTWQDQHYVSVVGFLFLDTRVLGLPFPFHRDFEEVNLRFYTRREVAGETRRGVTFLRELVPRLAIAAVARASYNEPYRALPMLHRFGPVQSDTGAPATVEYAWRDSAGWTRLHVAPASVPELIRNGSEEEFIAEHYWGYTRQRDGGTIEYRVEHPRWKVWRVGEAKLEGDLGRVLGVDLARALDRAPDSAFLADGSPVKVFRPVRIA